MTQINTFQDLFNAYQADEFVPDGQLVGMRVTLTGTMSMPRSTIGAIIERLGGEVATTVTKAGNQILCVANVDLDTFNQGMGGSSKLTTAKRNGTPMLSETQMVEAILRYADLRTAAAAEPPTPKVVTPPDTYGDW